MNIKKITISTRELILIGILLILAAYYFIVQGPIANQTQEYESRLMDINSDIEMAQLKARNKLKMKKAIDDIFKEYDGNPPVMPEYNNINRIIGELNEILGNTYDYNLTFTEETADETNPNIIRRPIVISFSTQYYNDAVSKIKMINKSENKYLIQNVSVSDSGAGRSGLTNQFGYIIDGGTEDSRYDIAMTMTSFEYKADPPALHEDAPVSHEDASQ
ncbi:MAG: hypothetical protein ACOX75_03855 [Lachnospiraceae bacterium]|jgi:Tfp pilus assembly protein PilO